MDLKLAISEELYTSLPQPTQTFTSRSTLCNFALTSVADVSVCSRFYGHVKQFKFLQVQLLPCDMFRWKIPISNQKRMLVTAGEPVMTKLLASGDGMVLSFGLRALFSLQVVQHQETRLTSSGFN